MESKWERLRDPETENPEEPWEGYVQRLGIPDEPALRHFLRQVIFDHFSSFNGRFPWFRLEDFDCSFEDWTANEIHLTVRYDRRQDVDFWYSHIGSGKPYALLRHMEASLTWRDPPVVFVFPSESQWCADPKLAAVHLIEGTHRISYLKKLLIDGKVRGQTRHRLLVCKPRL